MLPTVVDDFLDRPTAHKVAFWVVALGFVIFIFWQYFYKEDVAERDSLQDSVQELEVKISENRRIVRNLPKFKAEVARLDKKLELLLLELPNKKEIPAFLESISVLAIDTGLDVIKFTPRPQKNKEFFALVPVQLELEGTFHQLATFFDEVGHLSRIVNISGIELTIVKEMTDKVIIRARCLTTTFRYRDEVERKGRGRRGRKGKRK